MSSLETCRGVYLTPSCLEPQPEPEPEPENIVET